jgi:hypothetical protein
MFKDSPNVKAGIGAGVRAQFAGARQATLASMEIMTAPVAQTALPSGSAGGSTVPAAALPQ